MSYTVKLIPVVYRDLQKAKKWYNEQREALGEEFKAEVNKKSTTLKKTLNTIRESIKSYVNLW